MKRVLLNILITIWLVMAIILTISLLSFNDYKISVLGDYSFIPVDSKELEPDYKQGDLLVTKKCENSEIKIGDYLFYYGASAKEPIINYSAVSKKEDVTEVEATITMANEHVLSSEYVIGKTDDTKVISGLGSVISILQSRWGFLFAVIFPSIFLVIYEIYNVVMEVRRSDEEEAKTEEIVNNESNEE